MASGEEPPQQLTLPLLAEATILMEVHVRAEKDTRHEPSVADVAELVQMVLMELMVPTCNERSQGAWQGARERGSEGARRKINVKKLKG
jgi:hypothetical protein